jgi:hypothetical protein
MSSLTGSDQESSDTHRTSRLLELLKEAEARAQKLPAPSSNARKRARTSAASSTQSRRKKKKAVGLRELLEETENPITEYVRPNGPEFIPPQYQWTCEFEQLGLGKGFVIHLTPPSRY